MKIGKTKLKMSDGSIRNFKSQAARDRFEKVALDQARLEAEAEVSR